MITREQLPTLVGAEVRDRADHKIGTVGHAYVDHAGTLTWMSVKTGRFGRKENLVPMETAELQGEQVRIPYEKDVVKDAPSVDVAEEEPLTDAEVAELYQHYGLPMEGRQQPTAEAAGTTQTREAPETTRAREQDESFMTRSEEHMHVGTEARQAGRARLRKYVVTEDVQTTVPVSHEEVRIEREPIPEGEQARYAQDTELGEAEHEEVLYAERPVVEKETVPVERVRMDKERVTEEETIGGEVRHEEIDVESDEDQGRRYRRK
jgi:uncharacterized protein (TIGR02271 family)